MYCNTKAMSSDMIYSEREAIAVILLSAFRWSFKFLSKLLLYVHRLLLLLASFSNRGDLLLQCNCKDSYLLKILRISEYYCGIVTYLLLSHELKTSDWNGITHFICDWLSLWGQLVLFTFLQLRAHNRKKITMSGSLS